MKRFRLRSRRAEERAAARRRHPTAGWAPDVEEMRRRAVARAGDEPLRPEQLAQP